MSDVVLDPVTHRYSRGLQELASVSSVLRLWPVKPSWDGVDPDVIANANQRGCQVDDLLSAWLAGKLREIPAGTREDAKDLFLKLTTWPWMSATEISGTQVILSDHELAGTADIVGPGLIADLKTVYDLQPTYPLQLGGYCHLYEAQYGRLPDRCGIIHATKRFIEPKWVPYEVGTVVSEFRVLLAFWRLVKEKDGMRRKAAPPDHLADKLGFVWHGEAMAVDWWSVCGLPREPVRDTAGRPGSASQFESSTLFSMPEETDE